jgi:hypothetical protein
MIQSIEQMKRILCDAAKQPANKRRRSASTAVAVHDAHLHRLKAYIPGSANTYNPLGEVFAQQPPAPQNGHTTPSSQMPEEE